MHKPNTAILVAICHVGTPVMPSRNIINVGAVNGKMLKTIQTGLLGAIMSKETNHNGATANIEYIGEIPRASRTLGLIAATPADTTANKEYPNMK